MPYLWCVEDSLEFQANSKLKKKKKRKLPVTSCPLLPPSSLPHRRSKQPGLETPCFQTLPLSHTLNLLSCHRGFGQPVLANRHAVPLCLSVCNRCFSSAGTNGIQSVWLRNDRVTGLTHWSAIYLSMVSNGGVVERVAGPTDQSGVSLMLDRASGRERQRDGYKWRRKDVYSGALNIGLSNWVFARNR